MDITRTHRDGVVELAIEGRLDGYWADHVDTALADVVREGHHRVRLDLSKVGFLSSAGIAVMVKYYKQLSRINGQFAVVNPSAAVVTVLKVTRLDTTLIESDRPAARQEPQAHVGRYVEFDGLRLEAFDLHRGATLTCRAVGRPDLLAGGGYTGEHAISLGGAQPALAVGVGAFGADYADCRARFGELLSAVGATAYQPGDGTNVADYLVSPGSLSADVHLLYGLACEGTFSTLIRFETTPAGSAVGLTQLLDCCLTAIDAPAIGIIVAAEAASLVGAALRRSPAADRGNDADFFAHPGVRSRLTFTAERAFQRSLTLAVGVAARAGAEGPETAVDPSIADQLRPLGPTVTGHVHAAAFPFHPLEKGTIDLTTTVSALFDTGHLQGVLHLLHDDRGASGAGDSEFIRGACWVGPITRPGKER